MRDIRAYALYSVFNLSNKPDTWVPSLCLQNSEHHIISYRSTVAEVDTLTASYISPERGCFNCDTSNSAVFLTRTLAAVHPIYHLAGGRQV